MPNPYGNSFNDDGKQQKKQRIVSVINSTIPVSGYSWNNNRLTFRMDPDASDQLDKDKTLATIRGASPHITRVQADSR